LEDEEPDGEEPRGVCVVLKVDMIDDDVTALFFFVCDLILCVYINIRITFFFKKISDYNAEISKTISKINFGSIKYEDISKETIKSNKNVIKTSLKVASTYDEMYKLLNNPTVKKFNGDSDIMLLAASIDSRFFDLASNELQANSEFKKKVYDAKDKLKLTKYNLNILNQFNRPERTADRINRFINSCQLKERRDPVRLKISISK